MRMQKSLRNLIEAYVEREQWARSKGHQSQRSEGSVRSAKGTRSAGMGR